MNASLAPLQPVPPFLQGLVPRYLHRSFVLWGTDGGRKKHRDGSDYQDQHAVLKLLHDELFAGVNQNGSRGKQLFICAPGHGSVVQS